MRPLLIIFLFLVLFCPSYAPAQDNQTGQVAPELVSQESNNNGAESRNNNLAKSQVKSEEGDNQPPVWAEPEEAKNIFRKSVGRLDLQTEKSEPKEIKPKKKPPQIPKTLFLVLGGILLVGIVILIVRSFLKPKFGQVKKEESEIKKEKTLDPSPLVDTGFKADRLAGEGHIIEAMHAILLETIEELRRQKNIQIPSSLTSKEIVYSLNLGIPASRCLSEIVNTVEPTWFGGFVPDLSSYQNLRAKFNTFLSLLGQTRFASV
ncbi:MAG: hypothetical protein LBS44_06675 [Deltaproteobacteria bacterium]|jgi:hypothetical protein|nr:hypothetical protein [Deltaproteobacteria bacterium]